MKDEYTLDTHARAIAEIITETHIDQRGILLEIVATQLRVKYKEYLMAQLFQSIADKTYK